MKPTRLDTPDIEIIGKISTDQIVADQSTRSTRCHRDAALICWIFVLMDFVYIFCGLLWMSISRPVRARRTSRVFLLPYKPLKKDQSAVC